MEFNKEFILFSALAIIIFSSGCINETLDSEKIAKTIPQVEKFLNENPDADIKIILWNENQVNSSIDNIRNDCGSQFPTGKYYRVEVTDNENEIIAWYNIENDETVCVLREGNEEDSKENENVIDCTSSQILFSEDDVKMTNDDLLIAITNKGNTDKTDFEISYTEKNGALHTNSSVVNSNFILEPDQRVQLLWKKIENDTKITNVRVSTGSDDRCPGTAFDIDIPDKKEECRLGGFRLAQDLTYEASNNKISGIIDNNGRAVLTDWSFLINYEDGTEEEIKAVNNDAEINPGSFFTIEAEGVEIEPVSVRIKTNCENAYLDTSL